MLHSLAKNQFVKMTKTEDGVVEYGLVMENNQEENKYKILSIGFLNKNGEFLCYPTEVSELKETLKINDRVFEEVKDTKIRRKMNQWIDENFDDVKNN